MNEKKLRWVRVEEREPAKNGEYHVMYSVGSMGRKVVPMVSTFEIMENGRNSWSPGKMDWNYVESWLEETEESPTQEPELYRMLKLWYEMGNAVLNHPQMVFETHAALTAYENQLKQKS